MGVQVQTATRDGQGNPLSILNRQFISFSYGYKEDENGNIIPVKIEDFDLLAIFNGDRLNKNIYFSFQDTTTEQSELDGQLFWMSNYKPGELNFTLATDGMTSRQYENFKAWFVPGVERELILSEYHNRAILARIAAAPQISLLPFEEEVKIKIGNDYYLTKTSLYKGEISLSFIMDEPFWYAKDSYFNNNYFEQEKTEEYKKIKKQEMLKIIYEDNIPHLDMFRASTNLSSCLLANNNYYSNREINLNKGIILDTTTDISEATNSYLYYCGTAPSKPIISFDIFPQFNKANEVFFPINANENSYWIRVGNKTFKFSLPSVMFSYNEALKIVREFEGASALDLRKLLRDFLYNYYSRAWAIGIIDEMINDENHLYISSTGQLLNGFKEQFKNRMRSFFMENIPIHFSFNSQNGVVEVKYQVAGKDKPIIENAGNIVKSEYIIIEPKTLLNKGVIEQSDCLSLTTSTKLENVLIDYKYMYL